MSGPKIVSFVGWSGSGKTPLLVRLVTELKALGVTVAVVKHSGHPHPLHEPGSDTELLERAGADAVVFATPEGAALVRRGPAESVVPRLIADNFSEVALVLVEGWKDGPYPKIEVRGEGPRISSSDVIAVIDDGAAANSEPVPRFRRSEVQGIAVFLKALLGA